MYEKENALKEYLRMLDKCSKKRPFSNDKLTTEEFNKKYWMNCKFPYQYHTMVIEDGRDEREQLIINNIRSLKDSISNMRRMTAEKLAKAIEKRNREIAHIKIIITLICAIQFVILAAILIQRIRHHHLNTRYRK